jgi:undecaprenyl-diphosphatase
MWLNGLSVVILRVHFASDVVAGLCSGGAWLLLCIGSIEFARRRASRAIT